MREAFVDELLEWEGTPFHAHESVKHIGCDCVGLVIGALRELGYPLPLNDEDVLLPRTYSESFTAGIVTGWMERNFDRVTEKVQLGDVLTFNIGTRIQHIAIKIDDYEIIHAHGYKKRVTVSAYNNGWHSRLAGVYAVRGIG